jgi:hypothetical protein
MRTGYSSQKWIEPTYKGGMGSKLVMYSVWLPVVDEVITIIKQDLAGLIA